jgi:hypothetical protein
MATPNLTPEEVAQVSGLVSQYITAQRERYRPQAVPLTASQRTMMSGFFAAEILDGVRILTLDAVRVENPPFYPMLLGMGFTNLPDFSQMAAITFSDAVVSHEPFTPRLLFHELVHVEQYRQLGIQRFAELYVRGFLTGEGYDGIPLEVNAYALDERFDRQPDQRFSVADVVSQWIGENRL